MINQFRKLPYGRDSHEAGEFCGTIDNFEPLQGRKITLYPRTDPCKDYYISFLELSDQVKRAYKSIDISVSRFLEDNATDAQKQRDIDLLEFMLEK